METKDIFIFVFIIITALSGYYLRALSKSGAIAATMIGSFIAVGFGVQGLFIIGAFFVSASLFSKYKAREKEPISELHEKDGERDGWQVLANGGFAATAALLYAFFDLPVFLCAFLIVIASSTADTWASEIGVLSKEKPISVKGFCRVDPGTSGAVSVLGTVMALLGALFIAFVGMVFFKEVDVIMFGLVLLFGFLGNVADTLFGAFSQVTYTCERCGIVTERLLHCNEPTKQTDGHTFINNEVVNFLSGMIVSICGSFIYFLII